MKLSDVIRASPSGPPPGLRPGVSLQHPQNLNESGHSCATVFAHRLQLKDV